MNESGLFLRRSFGGVSGMWALSFFFILNVNGGEQSTLRAGSFGKQVHFYLRMRDRRSWLMGG